MKKTIKKVYNPVTKTYYKLLVSETDTGQKGTIIDKYIESKEWETEQRFFNI